MSNKILETKPKQVPKTRKRALQKSESRIPQQYSAQMPQRSTFYVIIASLIISGGAAIGIGGWQAALSIYVFNLVAVIWFGKQSRDYGAK
jgi:hypothetical protein